MTIGVVGESFYTVGDGVTFIGSVSGVVGGNSVELASDVLVPGIRVLGGTVVVEGYVSIGFG